MFVNRGAGELAGVGIEDWFLGAIEAEAAFYN